MIGNDGRPQVKNLLVILKEWLEYRLVTVRRRFQYRLDKILERLHILEGLMIAYLNIDEVIAIIRKKDKPKPVLIARFKITDKQAEAILELKLRNLAKLEEMKIKAEQEELSKERENLEKTLASKQRLKKLIHKELLEDAEKYGDERLSPIVERIEAKVIRKEAILPTEPITVILSAKGWVRAAKGHDVDPTTLNYRAGDSFKMVVLGRSNQLAVFLDSAGRSYAMLAHKLPSARGQGEPLTSHFNPAAGATFIATLIGEPSQYYLVASDAGYGFIAKLEDFYTKNRSGKALLTVPKGSTALIPKAITDVENQYVAAVTNEGRLLLFPLAYLPILARGKGNKIINILASRIATHEEYVVDLAVLNENNKLTLYSGKRHLTLKPSDLSYYQGERGRRGNKLPRGFRRVDYLEMEA
jgi:topoisomerase-4 subunit A